MAGLDAGIPFATMAQPVQPSALAGLRPLTFGAPLQFQAMPAFQVPESKPYIAEGIKSAIDAIGAGIKAKYAAERDTQKLEVDRKREERLKSEAENRLSEQIRHNKEIEAATRDRINATKSTVGDDFEDPIQPKSRNNEADLTLPIEGGPREEPPAKVSATYTPPEPSAAQSQTEILQGLSPVASAPTGVAPMLTLSGVSGGGPTMSLSVGPVTLDTPPSAAPAVAAAPVAAPIPVPEMTPEEQKAAAAQELELLKKIGRFENLPLPKIEEPKPKGEPKKEDPLSLGTKKGESDNSQLQDVKEAAKNPPALIDLGQPALDTGDRMIKGALGNIPSIQQVDPKDMRVKFRTPKEAYEQVKTFNELYPFATIQAEVKEPNKNVNYWHVDYNDVSDKRRSEIRTQKDFAANQEMKRERLNIAKDSKITAMATAFNNHPKSKLMDLRKDAMERMLVAVRNHYNAKKSGEETPAFIHQEMMDLFAQFASGKAPTEAQFHEAKSAFAGLKDFQSISKKFQYWYSGAKLDDRDVNTILNLMVDTYNTSAEQTNAKLSNIGSMLKDEHPEIKPYKMPVAYPLLKTKEYLTEQLHEQLGEKSLETAKLEYSKLIGEYIDEVNKKYKKPMPSDKQERLLKLKPIIDDYNALIDNNGVPANEKELRHFKKKVYGDKEYFEIPGFHSTYFGPRESSLMGGHYYGASEPQ